MRPSRKGKIQIIRRGKVNLVGQIKTIDILAYSELDIPKVIF